MAIRSRGKALVALACVGVAIAILVLVLVSSGSGDDGSESSQPTVYRSDGQTATIPPPPGPAPPAPPKIPRERRQGGGCWCGGPLPDIQPAELISGRDVTPEFSSETISPVVNGWHVASHRMYTHVYAGADPFNPSIGRFAIMRENVIQQKPMPKLVDVAGAGPLRIVRAPSGRAVVKSAQLDGEIHFTSKSGVSGVLHLADNSVTLDSQ